MFLAGSDPRQEYHWKCVFSFCADSFRLHLCGRSSFAVGRGKRVADRGVVAFLPLCMGVFWGKLLGCRALCGVQV
jgi:hypothetical protein